MSNLSADQCISTAYSDSGTALRTIPVASLVTSPYDYLSLAQASTTDTWTYKTGGASGTLVATVTITYTDSGKGTISNVAKT